MNGTIDPRVEEKRQRDGRLKIGCLRAWVEEGLSPIGEWAIVLYLKMSGSECLTPG
jgi:hypothetical protein